MNRPTRLLTLALALLALPVRAELVDRVAAVVNNDVVTLMEVQQRAAPLLAQTERLPAGRREAERQDILRRTLEDLIGEKLLEHEVKTLNVEATDPQVDLAIEDVKKNNNITDPAAFEEALKGQGFTLQSYREFMRKQISKVNLLQAKVRSKVKVSDEDVRAAYNQMSKLESQDSEIHARHVIILVGANAPPEAVEAARQKAAEVAKMARNNKDFADLARKYSQGSGAASGGDLGWFRRGTLAAEFETVAFNLKPGEVSDPVRTKFGWHVIKVEEVRKASAKPFDEVKDQLHEKLYREAVERQTSQYIADLRKQATVEIKIPELKPAEAPKDAPAAPGAGADKAG